jgi:mannose-1-phosphate guanylyltransferase/mannose-6-phosphate isomerase
MITPIILSGGNGTRLWPLSRSYYPKQYLALTNNQTLLQETVLRVTAKQFNQPMIICNNEHRFLAAEQLQAINVIPSHIVLETEAKNTAPAVAIACLLQEDPDQLLLVLPADHIIKNLNNFYNAIKTASQTAKQGKIITFGINPSYPETRYGYIECGEKLKNNEFLYKVTRFVEKPDINTAKQFFESGKYYWNSGIFLFKANTMLEEIKCLQPNLLNSCKNTITQASRDLDFLRLDSKLIDSATTNSIDYAIMEHTKLAAVVPVELAWSDLGSWDALWEISTKDPQGNVAIGDIITKEVNNSYIRSENQLISVIGLDNIVVIATQDAVLISSKEQLTQIKDLVQELKINNRAELNNHKRVYRPWGYYQTIDLANRFQVKRLMIKPGAKISSQIHYHRSEHWIIVEGTAKITKGEKVLLLHENESIYLPMGTVHRVENPENTPLHLIEVQSGSYLGEDDIVRIDDMYGRIEI